MNRNIKLVKDTLIYGIGTFGPKVISFLLLPIITSYFSTAEYGEWDLINNTITLIIPFISFEVLNAVYRWLLDRNEKNNTHEIISTGFFFTIRNLIIFNFIGLIFFSLYKLSNAFLILLMTTFMILGSFMQRCVRGFGYTKKYVFLGVLQTLFTLSTQLFCIFILNLRIEAFFIGSIVGNISVFLLAWYILRFHQYLRITKYSKNLLKSLLNYSIPMIPGAVSWWIMNSSDRYVITLFLGLGANGIYGVANKLPSIINMLKSVFQLAWQDSAILNYHDSDRDQFYSYTFKNYFRLISTSNLILISLTPILFKVIVANEFYEAWKYTGILFIGSMFATFSSFWGAAYHGSKNTKIILKTTLLAAGTNILINLALVNYLGLYASAISTVLASFIMWISRVKNKNNAFKIMIDKKDFGILISLNILVLLITYMKNIAINILFIILSIIIFLIYNKNILYGILKLVKKR